MHHNSSYSESARFLPSNSSKLAESSADPKCLDLQGLIACKDIGYKICFHSFATDFAKSSGKGSS